MYAILLSGPPGCGKSTYAYQHLNDFNIVSTDELIHTEAKRQNKTYSDIFEEYYPEAEQAFKSTISKYVSQYRSFVIDQTLLTEQSRKKRLELLHPNYKKIAVYFPAYTPAVLNDRIAKRVKEYGTHDVPKEVVEKMWDNYKIPQKNEGFDLVISSSHLIDVLKLMDFIYES